MAKKTIKISENKLREIVRGMLNESFKSLGTNVSQNDNYNVQSMSTSIINEEKIRKTVRKMLKELADDGNYYGGGLPDSQFKEEPPQDYGISARQIQQLKSMVDTLYDIANNTDGDTQQLFNAAEAIEGYLSANS